MPTFKGFVDLPEQFLRHGRIACLVPRGQTVPAVRRASPNLRKSAGIVSKPSHTLFKLTPCDKWTYSMAITWLSALKERVCILYFRARFPMILSRIHVCNLGKNGHSALLQDPGIVSYGWLVRLPLRCHDPASFQVNPASYGMALKIHFT